MSAIALYISIILLTVKPHLTEVVETLLLRRLAAWRTLSCTSCLLLLATFTELIDKVHHELAGVSVAVAACLHHGAAGDVELAAVGAVECFETVEVVATSGASGLGVVAVVAGAEWVAHIL